MSNLKEIGVQTEPEDDDVFDLSPTSTFQRGGSLTSPTYPGHQHGIFARVRNSFSSQKVKELKRQIRLYEEELERLNTLLENTNQEHTDATLRLTNIVRTNPFNVYITGACRNVQVGDSNTMAQSPSTDNLVADLEELTGKLTSAVEENTRERTNAEIKLRNNEVLMKEMQHSLEICKQMLGKLDNSTSRNLEQLKDLLESLTSDRSDDRIITDGVKGLGQYVIDRNRIVRTSDGLPWDIRSAINRLVYKFGHLTWQTFAAILTVTQSSIQARGPGDSADHTEGTTLLDRDTCARILAQWVTQSGDNSAEKLLNILNSYQTRAWQEMTETFQKETISHPSLPRVAPLYGQSQRSSMASSDTSGVSEHWSMRRAPSQLLPDNRTQFEHQLEAWKLQLEMNAKLDTVIGLMTEQKIPAKKKEMKIKQEDALYTRVSDEGHYV